MAIPPQCRHSIFFVSATPAIAEPQFEVMLETPEYEVRHYAPYVVAEVDVNGGFKVAGDEAFCVLVACVGRRCPVFPKASVCGFQNHQI